MKIISSTWCVYQGMRLFLLTVICQILQNEIKNTEIIIKKLIISPNTGKNNYRYLYVKFYLCFYNKIFK